MVLGRKRFLELKFRKVAAKDARKIRAVHDVKRLQAGLRMASEAKTLGEAVSLL